MAEKVNILIAVPAYGGSIKNPTVTSLLDLVKALTKASIDSDHITIDNADIALARNIAASKLLSQPEFTHILMSDNDMRFTPNVVDKMLGLQQPVVVCPAVMRHLNIDALIENAHLGKEIALARASKFCIEFDGQAINVSNGAAIVPRVGLPLALIHRTVFERLHKTGKVRHHSAQGSPYPIFGFFDRMTDVGINGEDYSFCHRWRELCGGEVWALLDHPIGHVGEIVYQASLRHLLTRN